MHRFINNIEFSVLQNREIMRSEGLLQKRVQRICKPIKMNVAVILYFVIFIACDNNKKSQLELEILNDSIATYYYNNPKEKDTIIKLVYKLTNKSEHKYYFNLSVPKKVSIIGANFDFFTKSINIIDCNNFSEKKYDIVYDNFDECYFKYFMEENRKKNEYCKLIDSKKNISFYYEKEYKNNFFINPKESIYFETLIKIYAKKPLFDQKTTTFFAIQKDKLYFAKLYLYVDGNFKDNSMPWHVLERIKQNNYKKYHGIIESVNKVPLKIIE
jgi:hypothetical protein